MKRTLLSAALSLSCLAATSAFAADGYVTGNVNLRAGPDVSYPSVDMLPAGTQVAIYGCVDGWSWCDVSTGEDRGWVAGGFLQEEYEGRRVYIADYGVRIGIPIVSFVFGAYWADHYRDRPWYGNRDHWSHIHPTYRPVHGPVHGPVYAHPAPPSHRLPPHPVAPPPPDHGRPVSAPHPAPRPAVHPVPPHQSAHPVPKPAVHPAPLHPQDRHDDKRDDKKHDDKDHQH